MNRDLLIALTLAGSLHALFLFGIPAGGAPQENAEPPTSSMEVFLEPLPEEPPPEEEEIIDNPQEAGQSDLPPIATLAEPPPMVSIDSVTQIIERPPPPVAPTPGALSKWLPSHTARPTGLGSGPDIFDLANLDRQPQARFQARPMYPFSMNRAGISGRVRVGFIVDAEGNVQNPYVIDSTRAEFETAALEAVAKWKFRPGMKNGRAVKVRMYVPIVFDLQEQRR